MNKALPLLSTILAWPLAAFFLFGAYGNAFISEEYAAAYAAWGYPDWFHYVTAALELTAGILLIRSATRAFGAALGAVVMAAATLTTLVNADYGHAVAPAVVFAVSLAVLGLSLALRRNRSR
ncbi:MULTISPECIES: DoxX family protein [Sphingomonadales]|uniref:DoxX n=1 Tax=Edaphosphingomonas haloaromaticamans TaxID=653954 RepID=A0A1S1HDZ1_9SPHN|nr:MULTISPECIES: DoxX family protein [Sphingomonadales]AGH51416.1 hypothetical protein G432_18490 [Sphingomonas sp. MM-1]OHT20012.1 hypothetical protein BHE75_02006 [Sphingomonas haloaromaticamans]WRO66129.1 DoxX family protein [Tsuneonella sp. CC-YZS046]